MLDIDVNCSSELPSQTLVALKISTSWNILATINEMKCLSYMRLQLYVFIPELMDDGVFCNSIQCSKGTT